ncbi:MAG TPA: phosphomannomutase/phosphoglucomutase [Alphaproteobacteria bacterium]|nr:phosphomannomutase/phosphoglucomutase [Alphaproteobacteria bacterium]
MNESGHRFDPTVLREYDIRGVVGKTLSADDARAVGRGFGSAIVGSGGRRVAVGYDGRLSSPALEAAVVEGLVATGLEAVRIGRGPTPMLYFAVFHLGLDGGIMVTGSHNPPDYNGFKMMQGKKSFWGADIQELGRRVAQGDLARGAGQARKHDVFDAYVARLAEDFRGSRELAVVWDPGNGAAGEAVVALTRRLPGRHVVINGAIDGTFPAHHPDPTEAKNLVQLQEAVRRERADVGIALDGDGDRIGVVDGDARILWGDQILALLAREVLDEIPGATIIADVKASAAVADDVRAHGGTVLYWKTGHSVIKSKMAAIKAPLAGEMSGHIFFAHRWYGFDDALYAAVRLLSIAAGGDKSLAALRDELPRYVNTPELRFPCAEDRKFRVVAEVQARLKKAGADVNDVDGARVATADGWWLLRASNTQDVLVARCEARDEHGLARLKEALTRELRACGIEPPAL